MFLLRRHKEEEPVVKPVTELKTVVKKEKTVHVSVPHVRRIIGAVEHFHGITINYDDIVDRVYRGIDISDAFIAGTIAGELVQGHAAQEHPITGLEGFLIGAPPEEHASFILNAGAEIAAFVHRKPGALSILQEPGDPPLQKYALPKWLRAHWDVALEGRRIMYSLLNAAHARTGVRYDPKTIEVQPGETVGQRKIQDTDPDPREIVISGKDPIMTSQRFFVENLAARLSETPQWITAWEQYPDEMNLAQLMANYSCAEVDSVILEFIGRSGQRF